MKIVWWIVAFSKAVRHTILTSVFGITISRCKHTPTCSQYLVQAIKQEGIVQGTYKGISRIMTCY